MDYELFLWHQILPHQLNRVAQRGSKMDWNKNIDVRPPHFTCKHIHNQQILKSKQKQVNNQTKTVYHSEQIKQQRQHLW